MTVTCKFNNKVLLIPGKDIWDASKWATAFLTVITGHDWGIPRSVINDKDFKFMSFFWRTFFEKLKTKLLISTIYHPQTDNQFEKINQTVEIALRYFLTNNPGADFVNAFPFFQTTINNAVSTATGLMPNEIVYGFRNNDTWKLITDLPPEDFNGLKLIYRELAKKTIIWVNAIVNLFALGTG